MPKMRPEILPRLTILLTIVSTFSLPLSLSFALLLAFSPSLFRYQLFVFPLYIHCTQRSYHLKPNLDPKARREEIPAGISLVSPSIPHHGFLFLVHFPCCIRNWNSLGERLMPRLIRGANGTRFPLRSSWIFKESGNGCVFSSRVQFVREYSFIFPLDGNTPHPPRLIQNIYQKLCKECTWYSTERCCY